MSVILLIIAISCVILCMVLGPIIARKLFPPPPSEAEFSITVAFSSGISKGQKIKIGDGDTVEVTRVVGNQVFFKRESNK